VTGRSCHRWQPKIKCTNKKLPLWQPENFRLAMMVATSAQTSAVREVRTIRLFTSEYALDNFPYDTALEIFLAKKKIEGV
jgi:hypothetical protein